jgi:hypothetical protein
MFGEEPLAEAINKSLAQEYRVLDGRPIYRLVWSANEEEVRCGNFTDWYGHILIREEYKAVRRVKKYWYYEKPSWVLEKLVFIQGHQALKEISLELVESRNGVYETIYAFRNQENEPLPLSFGVVNFIIHKLHNPTKLTASDFADIARKEEEDEVKYFEEELREEGRSDLFLFDLGQFVSTSQLEFRKKRQMEYVEKTGLIEGVSDARPILSS